MTFMGQATLVFFFVFFLLASGDLFKRKLVKLAGPSLEKKKVTVQILDDINTQIARFLFVRVVTSIAVGIVTWIAFTLIGLEQAFHLGEVIPEVVPTARTWGSRGRASGRLPPASSIPFPTSGP